MARAVTGWPVRFCGVVTFENLDRPEIATRFPRQLFRYPSPEREIGNNRRTHSAFGDLVRQIGTMVGGKTGGSDDNVPSPFNGLAEAGERGMGLRKVHQYRVIHGNLRHAAGEHHRDRRIAPEQAKLLAHMLLG